MSWLSKLRDQIKADAAAAKAKAEAAAAAAKAKADAIAAKAKAAAEKVAAAAAAAAAVAATTAAAAAEKVRIDALPEVIAFREAVSAFDAKIANDQISSSSQESFAVPYIGEYTPPDWSYSEEKGCTAEVETVDEIADLAAGYSCDGLAVTIGTSFTQRDQYPFPTLYHNASASVQSERDQELIQARMDNWFDGVRIPGAWVHGNVSSPDVLKNTVWTLRGTAEERAATARENGMGVNDADVGDDATDVFEALVHYFSKNMLLFIFNPTILAKITDLIELFVSNAFDDDLFRLKFQFIDPILLAVPETRTNNIEHWNFYPDNLPGKYPKQPFDAEFRNDDVISWLQVAHASPFSRLKPYTSHQSNFEVTNSIFRQTDAFSSDNLDTAMAEGRVFVCDFKEYHDANVKPRPNTGAVFYAGIAMFAVPKNGGGLKTIAMQSTQDTPSGWFQTMTWRTLNIQNPNKPFSEILTPKSNYWAWQQTKLAFMSMYAISNVIDHLSTHVFLYPLPISLYRNIPDHHPITALLEPHLMSLVANNHAGIFSEVGFPDPVHQGYGDGTTGLLSGLPGKVSGWTGETFIEETVRRANWYDFAEQGTPLDRNSDTDFSAIRDFPLHDDSGTFPIIQEWVGNYIDLYYNSDTDVVMDHEVQNFCSELEDKVAGFPGSLGSKAELVGMLTRIIYWSSNNHGFEALLSNQQLAPFGYFSEWLPRANSRRSEKDYLNTLPPLNYGLASFCGGRIFVDLPHDWHRSLGKYPHGQFMHDPRVYQHLDNFQSQLFQLDEQIKVTNANRRWEYNLMRPATMTCSPWN